MNASVKNNKTGIYIHWPFCAKKCPYCDFNTYVRQSVDEDAWIDAYLAVLDYYAGLTSSRMISTVFFGGGTPSLMPTDGLGRIVERIQKNWRVANDIEITMEANPTSVEISKFEDFRAGGVNRVSLGLQSFDDEALKFLGRGHNVAEGIKAIETAQRVFARSNFDLIYARPDQTLDQWRGELERAIDLQAGHLSLYQLTIEPETPFYKLFKRGDYSLPEEEKAADFYKLTQDVLGGAGLPAYEVSNHARGQDEQARHNLIYWNYDDYIGIGPGAHGRIDLGGGKAASVDLKSPDQWLDQVMRLGHGMVENTVLSAEEQFTEGFMMGMRLNKGLDLQALSVKTGAVIGDVLDDGRIQTAVQQGWITYHDNHMTASEEGMIRLNGLLRFLVK